METNLVSIITVCYNSEKTIIDTLESVLNQTYKNIEYIVVDGLSKDKTVEIIKLYQKKFIEKNISYKWISETDRGLYDAMNKGIKMVSGDIIGIINSDDWYELDAVERIVQEFKKNTCDVVYGNLNVYKNEHFLEKWESGSIKKLKKGMTIFHPTMFVYSECYKKNGEFDILYNTAADWDFVLRLYKNKIVFKSMDNILANFRLGGISDNFNKKLIVEKHEIRKKNKLYKILDIWYIYDYLKLSIPSFIVKKMKEIKDRVLKVKKC